MVSLTEVHVGDVLRRTAAEGVEDSTLDRSFAQAAARKTTLARGGPGDQTRRASRHRCVFVDPLHVSAPQWQLGRRSARPYGAHLACTEHGLLTAGPPAATTVASGLRIADMVVPLHVRGRCGRRGPHLEIRVRGHVTACVDHS
jgi:hypothetical protein